MVSVILLMAGKGTRMKENINKVLLPLGDKMIFQYPLSLFVKLDFEVICVISKDDEEIVRKNIPSQVKLVYGGNTRQESVYNGLMECTGDYVLIHDAARAFISLATINEIIENKNNNEAILTYLNVKDTIKIKNGEIVSTLPRESLIAATTPQCASKELFLEVYNLAKKDNFIATDDISLIEKYRPDVRINYILANEENFKITTPLDLKLAKLIVE